MSNFKKSLDYTLKNEGGFCVDSGGPTNCGITAPDVAEYLGVDLKSISDFTMRNLDSVIISNIYEKLYWNKMKLNLILDDNVATCIFDIGVNRGVGIGVKYAQKVAASLSIQDLDVDGIMGDASINAVNKCVPYEFITRYARLVKDGYEQIAKENPKLQKYLNGWMNRANRLDCLAASTVL